MKRILCPLACCLLAIEPLAVGQLQSPLFWRGVFLFGLDPANDKARFFSTLKDSLHLNLFQVTTFEGADLRNDYFLDTPNNLKVIVQENEVVAKLSAAEKDSEEYQKLLKRGHDERLEGEVKVLRSYPSVIRFYLRDEPTRRSFESWRYVRDLVAKSDDKKRVVGSVAAFADTGVYIEEFLKVGRPSELLVDPYYFFNSIPHPSLEGHPEIARAAGIRAWEDYDPGSRYGYYFGFVQLYLNQALRDQIRPAAEAVSSSTPATPLIFIPQLHGVLHQNTATYDTDNDPDTAPTLRPPSPLEIRLQIGIGMAYGAKGFLAFPYGTQIGETADGRQEWVVGLVPPRERDASFVDHSSNLEILLGKELWTGYREKWEEIASLYGRFAAGLGDTLSRMTWVGAKSWTHKDSASLWVPTTTATNKWDSTIVVSCRAETPSGYRNDLPQVEIGHLKRGKTDYLIVVNRRCYTTDRATISVRLSGRCKWRVRDIERPHRRWTLKRLGTFSEVFEPGEARVFRLDRR